MNSSSSSSNTDIPTKGKNASKNFRRRQKQREKSALLQQEIYQNQSDSVTNLYTFPDRKIKNSSTTLAVPCAHMFTWNWKEIQFQKNGIVQNKFPYIYCSGCNIKYNPKFHSTKVKVVSDSPYTEASETDLMWACWENKISLIIKLLFEEGADASFVNGEEQNAWTYMDRTTISEENWIASCWLLAMTGFSPNYCSPDSYFGTNRAIEDAIKYGKYGMAYFLEKVLEAEIPYSVQLKQEYYLYTKDVKVNGKKYQELIGQVQKFLLEKQHNKDNEKEEIECKRNNFVLHLGPFTIQE